MKHFIVMGTAAYVLASAFAAYAQRAPADGPQYTSGTNLVRPADYREWIFLSSGIDQNYNPPPGSQAQPSQHTFTNVFVNPSSYRSFLQTGAWPDGTILVLEARAADQTSRYFPSNQLGRFQGAVVGLEANVKDARFADGWAFFAFNTAAASAEALSGDALVRGQCVECHTKEAAVERTFVQFYPTLLEVARQKGTVKAGF